MSPLQSSSLDKIQANVKLLSYSLHLDSVPKVLHHQLFYLCALLGIEKLVIHYLRYGMLMNPYDEMGKQF